MGSLGEQLRKRRWSGGGLVLIAVLCPLLAYPLLRNRDIDHPLSAALQYDLCAHLPAPPASLPRPLHQIAQNSNGNISCELRDSADGLAISVALMTTRTASIGGPQRTSAVYALWLKEVKVSGAQQMRDEPGPWAMAQSYRFGGNQQFLAEDRGVMLALNSPALGADEMTAYARILAAELRAL